MRANWQTRALVAQQAREEADLYRYWRCECGYVNDNAIPIDTGRCMACGREKPECPFKKIPALSR